MILIINLLLQHFIDKDKIMLEIRTGGQTGVDRAALDAAIKLDLPYGGWCPQGRIDEQGIIPSNYLKLREIEGKFHNEAENYNARTTQNIFDSDATLILVPCIPLPTSITDGTLLTIEQAKHQNKEHFLFDLSSCKNEDLINRCRDWIKENDIHILNIAGPRESNSPGIYKASYDFLCSFLSQLEYSKTLRI